MNTTMTNQSKQRVTSAINIALEETRNTAIHDCTNAIWEQWEKYEKLLESQEARAIYENAYGEKFLALYDKRRSLRNKMELLTTIAGKIFDIKWQKQEEKEN